MLYTGRLSSPRRFDQDLQGASRPAAGRRSTEPWPRSPARHADPFSQLQQSHNNPQYGSHQMEILPLDALRQFFLVFACHFNRKSRAARTKTSSVFENIFGLDKII